ncbi:SpoIIE family protein phosphatase [Bacillus sp. FJAT-27231]|uniref:SpoIIE family protein phosphatase n=1 Tax=Bacillus sp. FJAT-27231 TaxID=1679168 RepID=UPI0009E1C6DD|nr:SpoIIE family protein phosphatase [Bacillus sp. FJAT-27231]
MDVTFKKLTVNMKRDLELAAGVGRDTFNSEEMSITAQRYKLLFDCSPHIACMLDKHGFIVDLNIKMEELASSKIKGQHFNTILYDEQSSLTADLFREALAGNTLEGYETIKDKQGAPVYIEYRSIPVVVDKELVGLCVAAKDITEKKELEWQREKELHVAALVQQSVLCQTLMTESLAISGHYVPAHNIGGDMYAWYQLDESRFGVLILDVMGHGVSAALISMSIRSVVEQLIKRLQAPDLIMKELNEHVYALFNERSASLHFFSALYTVVDVENKEIYYINAGHPPGILIQKHQCIRLVSSSPPLGFLRNTEFKTSMLSYEHPARIILFTDGLSACSNNNSSMNQSITEIEESFLANKQLGCEEYVQQVLLQRKNPVEPDDISLVKVEIF